MKFKTLLLTLICLYTTNAVMAQDYSLNTANYSWDEEPAKFTPDSADKAFPSVLVSLRRIVDYRFNENTKYLEQYYLIHNLRYLNDNKSVEENNKLYLAQDESQKLLNIKARVIKDGKVINTFDQRDFIQVTEDGQKYNMLAVKGLEPGTLLETIFALKVNDFNLYGDEYMQMSVPVKRAEFYLFSPSHLEFKCKSYNNFNGVKDSVVDNRRVYYSTTNNLPAFDKEEKYSLQNANKHRVEYVFHQNLDNRKVNAKWPELGRTFFDRMNNNYEKNEKDLEKLLNASKFKSAVTEEEKIYAIENYLKTTVSVDTDLEVDEEKFSETIKRKVASPFRFNQMMAQAYRKAGINVEFVLTCKKNYKRFDAEMDSWSYLRNVLFYFPGIKKFIDPQETFRRVGSINPDFLGQQGLFVRFVSIGETVSATAGIKLIPANKVEDNKDVERYTFTFSSDLSKGTIHYKRDMYNYAEQNIKTLCYVYPEDKKKEFLESFVKGFAENATVDELKANNYSPDKYDEISKPLQIEAKVTTDHYIEQAGEKILLKVGELIGRQAEMYQDQKRYNPVDIDFAHYYDREIVIIIPDGYTAKGLDKLNITNTFNNAAGEPSFGFTSGYTLQGNKLTITCKEYYNDLHYPSSIFEQYKKVINEAANFNKITILIEKQ